MNIQTRSNEFLYKYCLILIHLNTFMKRLQNPLTISKSSVITLSALAVQPLEMKCCFSIVTPSIHGIGQPCKQPEDIQDLYPLLTSVFALSASHGVGIDWAL